MSLKDSCTGADLVAAIEQHAARLGAPVTAVAKQLSPNPVKWLRQTAEAAKPKPHTIDRVRALLAGDRVPPPPPNNFQGRGKPTPPVNMVRNKPPEELPPAVFRDPCFKCGTRADVGCVHRRSRAAHTIPPSQLREDQAA